MVDFSSFKGQTFDAIKFVMAEKLPQDLWNTSPKKSGLVVVATKVNSVPEDIVIPIDVNPVEFIKELSNEENINSTQMDSLIKQLRDSGVKEAEEWHKEPTCKECGQGENVHPWICQKFVPQEKAE